MLIVDLTIYITTFLIGFPTIILAFCAFIRKVRNKPLPIDIFLLNLTVSDLIFLTFLPVKMKEAADNMVWNMPYVLCHFNLFVFFLPIYASTLFLTAVSAERYMCVAFPMKYKNQKTIPYTVLICVAIWVSVTAEITAAYKAAYPDSDEKDTDNDHQVTKPQMCYNNFTSQQLKNLLPVRLTAVLVFFCLPLMVCCFCYINFIWLLSKLYLIRRRRKLRAIGLALVTLFMFAVCFAPYNISHIVGFIKKENPKWRKEALLLSTLNTCFDTVIFFCVSCEMRRAVKRCVKRLYQFYMYLKLCLWVLFTCCTTVFYCY